MAKSRRARSPRRGRGIGGRLVAIGGGGLSDLVVVAPGDLVQLDTLDVRPPGRTHPFKQFTARDVVSRWDTLELRRSATAAAAAGILDALAARMPFAVRAISVDGGSEFMGRLRGGLPGPLDRPVTWRRWRPASPPGSRPTTPSDHTRPWAT